MTGDTVLDVVLDGWIDARRRGDIGAASARLHPAVVWQGVREDLVCPDRERVLENLRDSAGELPQLSGLELSVDGDQVLACFRSPDLAEVAGELLAGEIFELFTIEDGLIVRIEDFARRDLAEAAMRARGAARSQSDAERSRSPSAPVSDLIPFVHVADVERSIAFYELLGFSVTGTHRAHDQLDWAAMESADAKIMLAHSDQAIDPRGQAVLFYLYATDLAALQEHLRAHGARVGAILDGSPGPRHEMRLRDRDGYLLIIAQIESDAAA